MTPPTEPTSADSGPDGLLDRDGRAVERQAADVLAAYRAASVLVPEREAPRAQTRAAVLAAAARAVDARPQLVGSDAMVRPTGLRFGLRLPLALAASLLVGTVAWQLAAQFNASPSTEQVASAPAAPPAISPAASARPASTPSPAPERVAPPAPAPTPAASLRPAPTESPGAAPLARAASDESAARRTASAPAAPPQTAEALAAPVAPGAPASAAMARTSAPRLASDEYRSGAARRVDGSNVADLPPRTVAARLDRIAELRRGGRDADADAEIRALRLAYPEAQIPPALLLPQQR